MMLVASGSVIDSSRSSLSLVDDISRFQDDLSEIQGIFHLRNRQVWIALNGSIQRAVMLNGAKNRMYWDSRACDAGLTVQNIGVHRHTRGLFSGTPEHRQEFL